MASEPITVLLLEDDADVLEATRLILQDEGFRVLSATDLPSAERIALQVRRCVVLLDLSLPGDAHQFMHALHTSPDWQGQVLLFSAGDRLDERARALGADGAVAKPFEIDQLVSALRQHWASGAGQGEAAWH